MRNSVRNLGIDQALRGRLVKKHTLKKRIKEVQRRAGRLNALRKAGAIVGSI